MTDKRGSAVLGWDIGGAHVKVARISANGRLTTVRQYPCALWKGVDRLDALLRDLQQAFDFSRHRHAVTMTGELVDCFSTRKRGVRALLQSFGQAVRTTIFDVYTVTKGLQPSRDAMEHTEDVASANWHAAAATIAGRLGSAILVDIGSTTTDIVPIVRGRVAARGKNDGDRLRHGELIYTGVVRTPVMALTETLCYAGVRQRIAAENFAVTGDVYIMCQLLARRHYQAQTPDGRGLSIRACTRRLAGMLGRDLAPGRSPALPPRAHSLSREV